MYRIVFEIRIILEHQVYDAKVHFTIARVLLRHSNSVLMMRLLWNGTEIPISLDIGEVIAGSSPTGAKAIGSGATDGNSIGTCSAFLSSSNGGAEGSDNSDAVHVAAKTSEIAISSMGAASSGSPIGGGGWSASTARFKTFSTEGS